MRKKKNNRIKEETKIIEKKDFKEINNENKLNEINENSKEIR